MRKKIKENLLEIFKSLFEAHSVIKNFIDDEKYDNAISLLGECQDTALQLGSVIENSEGEDFITLSLIADYCKSLYEVASDISEYKSDDARIHIDKSLLAAENSAKNDIKVKLEVVFMPYKASMWDSLESVWKAADEDPDCDAYVVPIPYYDRNPDHSFGKYHYEGRDFPDYVPIVHYNKYNLRQRCPDVIYIHNPYDDCNYVTSVDPRYYSYNLKKYTDCLVYIPYYLAYGYIGDGQRMTPVYNYADYIVIQNESYKKFFSESIPDSKFLPLGSPKFDKIINACKNKPVLKPEWKIAEGKKVFFYNTTIAEMLCNPEAFLKKMVYVFNTFIEYGQNVCLLWRPHPLLESTFKSMCPQFLDAYIDLKNSYIANNVGIYDDNPDINYSIALSDVYLGDASSSVASSFSAVGKPLFILSPFIKSLPKELDNTKKIVQYISINRQGKKSDDSYLCVISGNLLFYSDANFNFDYIGNLSFSYNYLTDYIEIDEKIYICPQNAKDIVVFDKKRNISKIQVISSTEENYSYFCGAASNGRYICLIPDKYHSVVIFDTKSGNIEYVTDEIKDLNNCAYRRPYKGFCIHENYLYITFSTENKIWSYDLSSKKTNLITLEVPDSKGFVYAASDLDSIWLISHIGCSIIKWNPNSGKKNIISNFDFDINCIDAYYGTNYIEHVFSSAFFTDKYAYFTPGFGDKFIKIDKTTNEVFELNLNTPELFGENLGYNYHYLKSWFIGCNSNGNALFISTCSGKIFEMNIDTEEIKDVAFRIDTDLFKKLTSGYLYHPDFERYCCLEDGNVSIKDIIENNIEINSHDKMKQLESFSLIANNLDGTCGEKIFNANKGNIINENNL